MKKILLFLILFLFPLAVKGYYCNYSVYNKALKKAQNIGIMYDYKVEDDKAVFKITIYNVTMDQSIINTSTGSKYTYSDSNNGVITIDNVSSGSNYVYEIYSSDNFCSNEVLYKMYLTLPTYNKYYLNELCTGIENYKYCQKWFSTPLTLEEFRNGVIAYKLSLIKQNEQNDSNYKGIFDYLLEYYIKYYYYILPTIILASLGLIYIVRKKENKFKL